MKSNCSPPSARCRRSARLRWLGDHHLEALPCSRSRLAGGHPGHHSRDDRSPRRPVGLGLSPSAKTWRNWRTAPWRACSGPHRPRHHAPDAGRLHCLHGCTSASRFTKRPSWPIPASKLRVEAASWRAMALAGRRRTAASLMEAAWRRQASEVGADRRPMLVLAAIARHMMGDGGRPADARGHRTTVAQADRATVRVATLPSLAIDRADRARADRRSDGVRRDRGR